MVCELCVSTGLIRLLEMSSFTALRANEPLTWLGSGYESGGKG